jgi:O-Antigen ligase
MTSNQPLIKIETLLKSIVGLIVFSSFASSLKVEFGTISISLPQFSALVLLSVLLFISICYKIRTLFIFADLPSLLIYSYFASNLFSTILFSEKIDQSLKGCAAIFTYVLTYTVARSALKVISDAKFGVDQLLKANGTSITFGLASLLLATTIGYKNWGVSLDHLGIGGGFATASNMPSIQSLSVEPNLFAIITACTLCIGIAAYLLVKKSLNQLVLIGLALISILFAFTRSVYASLIISILMMTIVSNKTSILKLMMTYSFLGVFIFSFAFLLLPTDNNLKKIVANRLSTVGDFKSGTGQARIEGYIMALEGFAQNPLFGTGTLSAETKVYNVYTDQYQEKMGSPGWLNGALPQAIHDTGAIGSIILLGIFINMIIVNYRLFKIIKVDIENKSILLGFMGGNIILFISSQLSSPLWISFPYVYWAINMTFVKYCKDRLKENETLS